MKRGDSPDGEKEMKKTIILLIALMVISVGLLSGCVGKKECSHCGGTGVCPTCHGGGYVEEDSTLECPTCGGDGWCPYCGGTGHVESTPGFELLFVIAAIGFILYFRKRKNS